MAIQNKDIDSDTDPLDDELLDVEDEFLEDDALEGEWDESEELDGQEESEEDSRSSQSKQQKPGSKGQPVDKKKKKPALSFNTIVIAGGVVLGAGIMFLNIMNEGAEVKSQQAQTFQSTLNIGEVMDGTIYGQTNKDDAPAQAAPEIRPDVKAFLEDPISVYNNPPKDISPQLKTLMENPGAIESNPEYFYVDPPKDTAPAPSATTNKAAVTEVSPTPIVTAESGVSIQTATQPRSPDMPPPQIITPNPPQVIAGSPSLPASPVAVPSASKTQQAEAPPVANNPPSAQMPSAADQQKGLPVLAQETLQPSQPAPQKPSVIDMAKGFLGASQTPKLAPEPTVPPQQMPAQSEPLLEQPIVMMPDPVVTPVPPAPQPVSATAVPPSSLQAGPVEPPVPSQPDIKKILADNEKLSAELKALRADQAKIKEMEQTIASLKRQVKNLKQDDSSRVGRPSVDQQKPPVYPSPRSLQPAPPSSSGGWELRAAQPGKAWVSKRGQRDIQSVELGQTLPGIGKVTEITNINGLWTVVGTTGSIKQ